MEIYLNRLKDNGRSTTGELIVDGLRLYTLEDTFRNEKIYGQTRIPAGRYEIKLRTQGRFHNKYLRDMPHHRGMLWLQNVPGFEYILIHIGNTAEDSSGCILVGSQILNDDFISESTIAYIRLYAHVIEAFERNEKVFINIKDNESDLHSSS